MQCTLCPRACGVERNMNMRGFCGAPDEPRIARAALHAWEEPPISGTRGSGTVFFSGCNLRCIFCQNYAVSHDALGRPVTEEELADVFLSLQEAGAHNINLVTPSQYAIRLVKILERARKSLHVPIVYNCGGYESVSTLRALDGLVDVYLPDFKYADPVLAARYSDAADYPEVAQSALAEMLRQVGRPVIDEHGLMQRGMIVRHLVLPGARKNSIDALRLLAQRFGPDAFSLSLMSQYTPAFATDCPYPALHRRLTTFEYESVTDEALRLGFSGNLQAISSASADYTPDFTEGSLLSQSFPCVGNANTDTKTLTSKQKG